MKRIMSFYQNLLYVKVMPSDPKTIPFYERYGFQQYDTLQWCGSAFCELV